MLDLETRHRDIRRVVARAIRFSGVLPAAPAAFATFGGSGSFNDRNEP
jgi:hypothetical protein